MDDSTLLEIIGIAHESKMLNIKNFIRFVLEHTLDENDAGYELTVESLNLKEPVQQSTISKPADMHKVNEITTFDSISLLQFTEHRRDHIIISREGDFIVIIAAYEGPPPSGHEFLGFSVNIDIFNNPRFIHSNGTEIGYSELLSRLNAPKKKDISIIDQWEASRKRRKRPTLTLEHRAYEKITRNKSIENGQELPNFQLWRKKTVDAYRAQSGKKTQYKDDFTKGYTDHLLHMMHNSITPKKKSAPKKTVPQEPITKEQQERLSLESRIYELIKGRSAFGKKGSQTKRFQAWCRALLKGGMTKINSKFKYK